MAAGLAKKHAPILHFHPQEGIQCCFPSDAQEAYPRARLGRTGEIRKPNQLDDKAPCYFETYREHADGDVLRLKYWIWYNYNDFPQGPDIEGSHPGDWESIDVIFEEGQVAGYCLSNHDGARFILPDKAILSPDGRINVWVGNGSHAHYESPTAEPFCVLGTFCDEIEDGGPIWDTGNHLVDVKVTNFYKDGYVGDWADGQGSYGPPARRMDEYTVITAVINVKKTPDFIELKIESDERGVQLEGHLDHPGYSLRRAYVGSATQNIWLWWDNLVGIADLKLRVNGVEVFDGTCIHNSRGEIQPIVTCTSPRTYRNSGIPRLEEFPPKNITYVRL